MGWVVHKEGEGFTLENTTNGRRMPFANEGDSHAAGEAIRAHLGRPSVTEMLAQKAKAEADLRDLQGLRQRQASEVAAANKRADEGEESHPGRVALEKERQSLLAQLVKERQEHRDERERLSARVATLEAEADELAGTVPVPMETAPR